MAADQKNVSDPRSDEELMQLYQRGEEYAFETLYWRHQQGVYNFIRHFIGEQESYAEELFQEVFLKVVKSRANYRPTAKFTTWLYQVVRNGCIDHLRKMKHRKTTSLSQPINSDEEREIESTIADANPSPEKVARTKQISEVLREAIQGLTQEQREVLLLREDLNLSFAEIAGIIGCPINTAKSRMRYALEHLRKKLESEGITRSEVMEDELFRM